MTKIEYQNAFFLEMELEFDIALDDTRVRTLLANVNAFRSKGSLVSVDVNRIESGRYSYSLAQSSGVVIRLELLIGQTPAEHQVKLFDSGPILSGLLALHTDIRNAVTDLAFTAGLIKIEMRF